MPGKQHGDLPGAAFGAHMYGDDEDVAEEPETIDDAEMPDPLIPLQLIAQPHTED